MNGQSSGLVQMGGNTDPLSEVHAAAALLPVAEPGGLRAIHAAADLFGHGGDFIRRGSRSGRGRSRRRWPLTVLGKSLRGEGVGELIVDCWGGQGVGEGDVLRGGHLGGLPRVFGPQPRAQLVFGGIDGKRDGDPTSCDPPSQWHLRLNLLHLLVVLEGSHPLASASAGSGNEPAEPVVEGAGHCEGHD